MHAHHHHGHVPGLAAPALAHHPVVDLAPPGPAAAHAVVMPTSDEAPRLAGAEGFKGQETEDPQDCAQHSPNRKRFTTLAAQAAIAGCTLHHLAGGAYLLCRWGMAKEVPDLPAVAALLAGMGVTP